jgi:hypothetical protein
MFAMAVAQEAEAFTGGVARRANADMVDIAQAKSMHRKASAADVGRDFPEHVILRTVFVRNRE